MPFKSLKLKVGLHFFLFKSRSRRFKKITTVSGIQTLGAKIKNELYFLILFCMNEFFQSFIV
jgi:hypothetical protein